MPRTRRIPVIAVAALVSVALTACGTPPWEEIGAVETTPTPTAEPTTPAEITTVVNELANGSTLHLLTAGSIAVEANYFSTLSMDQWTADANKPLSISLSADLDNDDGQKIYLSQMGVVAAVYGPDGVLAGPPELLDRSTVSPGYLVKDPYSYSQTFILPAVDPAATYVTLSLTYEFLLQSKPKSKDFAKQTASDTLTIAIAQP